MRTRTGALTVALVVLAASLPAIAPAQAAPGDLDPTFTGDGLEATSFGKDAFGSGVALQTDGKIVVAGTAFYTVCEDIWCSAPSEFALARYNADGTPDTSFSADGRETTDFGGQDFGAYDVALQSDGKIVAVGHTGGADFALARYNATGTLDTSFSGDGKQITDFGDPHYGTDFGAYDVALQPDGKIVAVGRSGNGAFALARYNDTDGSPRHVVLGRREGDDGPRWLGLRASRRAPRGRQNRGCGEQPRWRRRQLCAGPLQPGRLTRQLVLGRREGDHGLRRTARRRGRGDPGRRQDRRCRNQRQ